jgi:hypothetical protein
MDSIFTLIDVRPFMDRGLRDDDLQNYLEDISDLGGKHVVSKGRGAGSIEPEETAGLDYRVTQGGAIQRLAPHLWRLYNNPDLARVLSRISGFPVHPSRDLGSGVNINDVRKGGRYEAHVDSTPFTLLLFGSGHEEGAALEVQVDGSWVEIQPLEGFGVFFDGSVTPHRVAPAHNRRLSVPMVFVPEGFDELSVRAEVDGHLYG